MALSRIELFLSLAAATIKAMSGDALFWGAQTVAHTFLWNSHLCRFCNAHDQSYVSLQQNTLNIIENV